MSFEFKYIWAVDNSVFCIDPIFDWDTKGWVRLDKISIDMIKNSLILLMYIFVGRFSMQKVAFQPYLETVSNSAHLGFL